MSETEKGSYYNQSEWLEEYEYQKGLFYGKEEEIDCEDQVTADTNSSSESSDGSFDESSNDSYSSYTIDSFSMIQSLIDARAQCKFCCESFN